MTDRRYRIAGPIVVVVALLTLTACDPEPTPPPTTITPAEQTAPSGVTTFTVQVDGRDVWCVAYGIGSSSAVMSCGYKQGASEVSK